LWAMEDQKNGWRCDGDKHRDDRPRRADNGGFCGPKEVMEDRMRMKKARDDDVHKMVASFREGIEKA
jgi:hypothetical protein